MQPTRGDARSGRPRTCVPDPKGGRCALRLLPVAAALPFLLGSTCPTEEPVLPPRLHAPTITRIEAWGYKIEGEYREAVHLEWEPPNQDSNTVGSYAIMRNALVEDDTAFSLVSRSIPSGVTSYDDPIGEIGFPGTQQYKRIAYRITCVDTVGQEGDTSASDTFVVMWPPQLVAPVDTIRENRFAWTVTGLRAQYRTHMVLWNAAGVVWRDSLTDPVYGDESTPYPFSRSLPDSLWPLPAGIYFFGARVVAYSGEKWNRETIAISGPLLYDP